MDRVIIEGGVKINSTIIRSKWYRVRGSRTVIVFVHGTGRNVNMYPHIFDSLNRRNISVFAFDLRFHGLSGGGDRNKDLYDMNIFLRDLEFILKTQFPPEEFDHIFVMAHSMGSMIVWGLEMQTSLKKVNPRVRGVLSLGTSFDVGHIPWIARALLQPIWASDLCPKFLRQITFGQQTRSTDQSIGSERFVKVVEKEDIRHYNVKSGQFCGIYFDFLKNVIWKNFDKVTIPCRFIHGTNDTRCTIYGVLDGYKQIPDTVDKSMKIYKDYYHELLLEENYEKVLDDVCDWVDLILSTKLGEKKNFSKKSLV